MAENWRCSKGSAVEQLIRMFGKEDKVSFPETKPKSKKEAPLIILKREEDGVYR